MHKSAPEYCTYIMVLLLGGLYAPVSLHAQSYLYGYVRDMSSLPVENANVIFTSESNEMISFAATTDSQGKYEVKAPISVRDEKPGQFILLQNYPNPFNPATVIPFTLDRSAHITLTIYNIMGQKVRLLLDGPMDAGYHTVTWNATDDRGNRAASGVYFYHLRCDDSAKTGKMLLLDGGGALYHASGKKADEWYSSTPASSGKLAADSYRVLVERDGIDVFEQFGLDLYNGIQQDFTVTRSHPVPFAARGDYLGVWNGRDYTGLFIKGVNLGVSIPGTQPGELAASAEQYRSWFKKMGDMGVNALRVYTLHYPRFYDELRLYNLQHRDRPLYLLQGIWLDEEYGSLDLYDAAAGLDAGIEEVIDCVHGNRSIEERFGRASGRYTASVSRWTLGYIIGREIYPAEVIATNEKHPGETRFQGTAARIEAATPADVWAVRRMDKAITHERGSYGVERPVSISSWPTLDPLSHPSEPGWTQEDIAALDLEKLDDSFMPAGFFISYHAYPYYPDFMSRDTDYLNTSDAYGPDSYLGYLYALKKHYAGHPLVIAEYGVPSSWGNAHFAQSGMNHGGHDEERQGIFGVRLMNNIFEAGCGGGVYFSWIDEWFKNCWITQPISTGSDRRPLWHNVTNPEQNYGLIAFDSGPPDFGRWKAIERTGYIRKVETAYDNEFFHCRLTFASAPTDKEAIVIAYDTYRQDKGESILPNGATVRNRAEFCLGIVLPDTAQLYITEAYDTFGIWHGVSGAQQLYHSISTNGAPWSRVRWKNNREDDAVQEIGMLRIKHPSDAAASLDAVVLSGNTVTVRIPWTLLQFTDPSALMVMDDDRATPKREESVTDGIALTIFAGDDSVETPRCLWSQWNAAPPTVERDKASLEIIKKGMELLPSGTRYIAKR